MSVRGLDLSQNVPCGGKKIMQIHDRNLLEDHTHTTHMRQLVKPTWGPLWSIQTHHTLAPRCGFKSHNVTNSERERVQEKDGEKVFN